MAAPQVLWYDATNTTQQTQWDLGTVDAGSISADKTFLIWNNRGGTSPLSDMTDCTITTKDSAGGNTGELVVDKWIEVRVDSLGESQFTPIGGNVTKLIQAEGAPSGVISGAANDGNMNTSETKKNFAKVTLHANVPALATAGNVSFLTRITYRYI